jgi:NAD(P)-dependent dehydrogenase (short-subunit alcohol dehydrogenase family)
MPLDSVKGKTALVTGSGRGIGRDVIVMLVRNGNITGQTINVNGGRHLS